MQNFRLTAHQHNIDVVIVTSSQQLEELSQQWLNLEAIALDTEFDRTNTYYHNLALIQINDGSSIYLIDPLRVSDLSALAEVFSSPRLIKAIHSCSEDIEALFNAYNFSFNAIFDTQIACAMLGIGLTLGYSAMIEQMQGISLDKGHTKTDWLQRPLSQEQLIYAAQDVQFLLPTYCKLRDKLLIAGHFDYVLDDGNSIFKAISKVSDFSRAYIKVKGSFKLNPKQLNRLQRVAAWREQLAQDKNIPKTFVFRDPQLIDICQIYSPNTGDLLSANCNRSSIRRYGSKLLSIIEEADKLPQVEYPKEIISFHKIPKAKEMVKHLKAVAKDIAEQEGLPLEVLSNKRLLEYYIMHRKGYETRGNRFWDNWRKALLNPIFAIEYEKLTDQTPSFQDDQS